MNILFPFGTFSYFHWDWYRVWSSVFLDVASNSGVRLMVEVLTIVLVFQIILVLYMCLLT